MALRQTGEFSWPMDSEFAALIVRQKCEKLIADHPELAGIITEELKTQDHSRYALSYE